MAFVHILDNFKVVYTHDRAPKHDIFDVQMTQNELYDKWPKLEQFYIKNMHFNAIFVFVTVF